MIADEQRGSWVTQSIVISKEAAGSLEEARKIAAEFGKAGKVDITPNSYRFRQRDPGDFSRLRSKPIKGKAGVTLVGGPLK